MCITHKQINKAITLYIGETDLISCCAGPTDPTFLKFGKKNKSSKKTIILFWITPKSSLECRIKKKKFANLSIHDQN